MRTHNSHNNRTSKNPSNEQHVVHVCAVHIGMVVVTRDVLLHVPGRDGIVVNASLYCPCAACGHASRVCGVRVWLSGRGETGRLALGRGDGRRGGGRCGHVRDTDWTLSPRVYYPMD